MSFKIVGILLSVLLLTGCGDILTFEQKEDQEKSVLGSAKDVVEDIFTPDPIEIGEAPAVDKNNIESFFLEYRVHLPVGNRVRVCSGTGCKFQQTYRLQSDTLKKAKGYFSGKWSPKGEREGLAEAIGYIESVVGPATGTDLDRAGSSWWDNGKKDQMGPNDEALNTLSYLYVLYKYELIRYHDLLSPRSKWQNPYSALIRDRKSGKIYSINSGDGPNGSPALITELD